MHALIALSSEGDDVDSYLINTPGCVIQNFDVLSPELTKFLKGYPKVSGRKMCTMSYKGRIG